MSQDKEITNSVRKVLCNPGIDPEGNSKAILVKHVPFGFFEKEVLNYFLQFGAVRRVRIPRNKKTGNHKGWAFVLFTDYEVAQLAAEAMDGYLMFEKRLECKVMKNKDLPSCLCKGPRLIPPPLKNFTRRRHMKKLNKAQSGWCEEAAKKRLLKKLKIKEKKFVEFGYQLPAVVGFPNAKQVTPLKMIGTNPLRKMKSDGTKKQLESRISKKVKKTLVTRTATDVVDFQRRR